MPTGVNYASSATGGYRRQLPGSKEAKGRFEFVLCTTDVVTNQLSEGDVVVLKLHVDDGNFYSVPAIVESVQLDVDVGFHSGPLFCSRISQRNKLHPRLERSQSSRAAPLSSFIVSTETASLSVSYVFSSREFVLLERSALEPVQ